MYPLERKALIVSFGDKVTEDLFHGRASAKVRRMSHEVQRAALVKLDTLNAASSLLDLTSPPGNRLEMLKGDLRSSYSIRVNDQWRLVFRYENTNAHEVRLTDYH
jgi:proteic killer suppression protein